MFFYQTILAIFVLTHCDLSSAKLFTKHLTVKGEFCMDECGLRGKTYQWCYKSDQNWDYCSTIPGTDYHGNECKSTSQCQFKGSPYSWCYLKKGSWDKCGTFLQTDLKEYQNYPHECADLCELDPNGYTYCFNKQGEQNYCSSLPGYASNLDLCTTNCDYNGGVAGNSKSSYTWCKTDGGASSWNYCSFTQSFYNEGDLRGIRWKRADVGETFRTVTHPSVRLISQFVYTAHGDYYKLTKELRRLAIECLQNWARRDYPVPLTAPKRMASAGEEYGAKGVRLDLQHRYHCDECGVEYLNIQLQVNVNRIPGQSTTIAQVSVPSMMAESGERGLRHPRYVFHALLYSMDNRMNTKIVQRILPPHM